MTARLFESYDVARDLYGDGWHGLPAFVRDAAGEFVTDLVYAPADARDDLAHESADSAVPVYRSELLALLADPCTADAVLRAAEDLGGLQTLGDSRGGDMVTGLVSLGVYGVLSETFAVLADALQRPAGWSAFGLEDDAAEVAAALLPEWSGTVRELLDAAPALAAEAVTA